MFNAFFSYTRNGTLNLPRGTMEVPAWLQRAQSASYIKDVLDVLDEREQTRAYCRSPPEVLAIQPEKPLAEFYSVGRNPAHRTLNRYMNIEPYDRTRLDPGGHYLNANWVRELHGKKWWIAAQAPLPNTAYTFLSVLLEQVSPPGFPTNRVGVRTIVQLTKEVEGGRRKAHPYFPDTIGLSTVVNETHCPWQGQGFSDRSFEVTLMARKMIEGAHCTQSTVAVTPQVGGVAQGQPVVFNHLLYTAWPDHGVPEAADHQALINFVAQVDEINRIQTSPGGDPDPPVMVNCSAGIGRTGAFITLSSLMRWFSRLPHVPASAQPQPALPPSPLGPLPPEKSEDLIMQEIDSCRDQRPGMVQTDEQVAFLYLILEKALSSG